MLSPSRSSRLAAPQRRKRVLHLDMAMLAVVLAVPAAMTLALLGVGPLGPAQWAVSALAGTAAALSLTFAFTAARNRDLVPHQLGVPLALSATALAMLTAVNGLEPLTEHRPVLDALGAAALLTMLVGSGWSALAYRVLLRRHRIISNSRADRDALTGLLTRQGVLRAYATLPHAAPLGIAIVDLNGLKLINDVAGHGAGDEQIRAVAHALRAHMPGDAIVGRWGGDEFLTIVPNVTPEQLDAALARASETCPRPRPSLEPFAYGVTSANASDPLERAIAIADERMYEKKRAHHEDEARLTGQRVPLSTDEFTRQLELLQTPEEVVSVGLSLARYLLRLEGAAYYQRTDDTFTLTEYDGPKELEALHRFNVRHAQQGHGLLGAVVAGRETTWSADYQTDPRAVEAWQKAGLKSIVATPVYDAGRLAGIICLTSFDTWHSITPQSRRLLEALALRLGHALERARVVGEVRASIEGGMMALGVAMEARDLETSGHTERVVRLAAQLGRALGLSGVMISDLKQGAYLHDIGKLSVPDSILLKPDRLSDDEWLVMKQHALRGFEMASRIPALSRGALDLIRHHHERWDGHGYPDGLAGEEIPLVARIFAVCDVYDALTSERVYKRLWTDTEAQAELERQAGAQFDPRIVHAFLDLLGPSVVVD